MGLFEQLKKQARQVSEDLTLQDTAPRPSPEQMRFELASALERIYTYLRELVDQLGQSKPAIQLDFALKGFGLMQGMSQEGYALTKTGARQVQAVHLMFVLRRQSDYRFDVQTSGDLSTWLAALKGHGIHILDTHVLAQTGSGQRVRVSIAGQVPVSMKFVIDEQRMVVSLALWNYEGLGKTEHRLALEDIDQSFLDALGHAVLRRDMRFLTDGAVYSGRSRALAARTASVAGKQRDPQDTVSTQVQAVLKRKPVLHLRFGDQELRLEEEGGSLSIGRSTDSDIAIEEAHISRHHARIECRDGAYYLIDRSRNGTYVRSEDAADLHVHQGETKLPRLGLISPGTPPQAKVSSLIYFDC